MGFEKDIVEMLYGALTFRREDATEVKESASTNYDMCKECAGLCCQNCGCHFSPYDFKEITFEALKREIKKGYISIEWVDGDMFCRAGGCYILRIRNKGKEIVDTDFERSPCILLTDKGCKLKFDSRPLGGKLLIPYKRKEAYSNKETLMCYSEYDIGACFDEWIKYQDILEELAKYFRKHKDFPCSI